MGFMVAAWAISMSLGTGDLRTIELNASSFGLHCPARLDDDADRSRARKTVGVL
jgi:hypothetical protein